MPGHVFGDFDVCGTRLFGLRQLEGFAKGFGNDVGNGQAGVPFRHRAEQRDDVQMLVGFLVHSVVAGLAGERHQRRAVHVGIGHAGDEIRRAWPQRGEAHTRFAGQPAVHVRHERRALLMARHDEADGRVEQRVEQIHVLLAWHAEDVT